MVHGHSSHHPLPVEVYRSKLILYGCGDLINDCEGTAEHGSLRGDVGCLYIVTLRSGSGRLDTLDMVPFQRRRFRLGTADAAAQEWLAQVFASGQALGEQPVRHGAQRWRLRASA